MKNKHNIFQCVFQGLNRQIIRIGLSETKIQQKILKKKGLSYFFNPHKLQFNVHI